MTHVRKHKQRKEWKECLNGRNRLHYSQGETQILSTGNEKRKREEKSELTHNVVYIKAMGLVLRFWKKATIE